MNVRQLQERVESQGGWESLSLTEALDLLEQFKAYVMQTGPKGGRFYYTPKGRKVYRVLKGRRKPKEAGREGHDPTTFDAKWRAQPDVDSGVGPALRELFGDKAPTPTEVKQMFGAPELGLEVRNMGVSAGYNGTVNFRMNLTDKRGNSIAGSYVREFRKDSEGKPYVYHNFLQVGEQYQGGGRVGAVFANSMEGYKKLGIQKVEVTAGLDAGPYVWAKFGFQPKTEQDAEQKISQFKQFASRSIKDGGMGLTEAAVEKILAKTKDADGKLDTYKLASVTLKGKVEGKETTVPLGRDFLLHGDFGMASGWSGVVRLDDPKAMARWKKQTAKGVKQRKAAIAEGKEFETLSSAQLANQREGKAEKRRRYTQPTQDMVAKAPKFGRRSKKEWAEHMLAQLKALAS